MKRPGEMTGDELVEQALHDQYYYRAGRQQEREWIVGWLRGDKLTCCPACQEVTCDDDCPAKALADALERLQDLDDNPI